MLIILQVQGTRKRDVSLGPDRLLQQRFAPEVGQARGEGRIGNAQMHQPELKAPAYVDFGCAQRFPFESVFSGSTCMIRRAV
jgi:hypothetical protein